MTSPVKPTLVLLAAFLLFSLTAAAESCAPITEMDAASLNSIQQAGQQFAMAAGRGDSAALRQSAIASLAGNFAAIDNIVQQNKAGIAGAQPSLRAAFLLDAPGAAALERADFLCGVWGTPTFTTFSIQGLPPGKYALVVEDFKSASKPSRISMVLKDEGGWKLAGFYLKPLAIKGNDGLWFWRKAREYKAKGQVHNAWFYYREARDLLVPVDFVSTPTLDKLDSETQEVVPKDFPVNNPVDLPASNGKTYKVTQLLPITVEEGMDLVVRYAVPDVSNTQQLFNDNMAVISAVVAKYPELRETFAGVVARATDANGKDYGTLLAMKDVK